jgi:antitoxin MazE
MPAADHDDIVKFRRFCHRRGMYEGMPIMSRFRAKAVDKACCYNLVVTGEIAMRAVLRKLGNSSGVIIPKSMLAEIAISVGDTVDITLEEGCVVIAPVKRRPRAGWAEASRDIAAAGDDEPVWPAFPNAEDQDLVW